MIKKNEKVRTEDAAEKLMLEPRMCGQLCWDTGRGSRQKKEHSMHRD